MARRIILKEGGLSGEAPSGFKLLGLDESGLSLKTGKTISGLGGGSKETADVVKKLEFELKKEFQYIRSELEAGGGGDIVLGGSQSTNIFAPDFSFNSTSTGTNNIALGASALANNDIGQYNIALGKNALLSTPRVLSSCTKLSSSFALNEQGASIAKGNSCEQIMYASSSICSVPASNNNISLGQNALHGNKYASSNNIALGQNALRGNTTGYKNVALGTGALYSNRSGSHNLAIGDSTLRYTDGTYFTRKVQYQTYDAAVNDREQIKPLGAEYQTYDAAVNDPFDDVFLPEQIKPIGGVLGSNNIALGNVALKYNTNGYSNVALGCAALYYNTTGRDNVAIGRNLRYNTTGNHNVALGNGALYYNTTGNYNVALGYQSLSSNTCGEFNIALGYQSLSSNTCGEFNIALGFNAQSGTTHSNTIVLGKDAQASSSNQLVLGSSKTPLGVTASAATASHILNVRLNGADYQILLNKVI